MNENKQSLFNCNSCQLEWSYEFIGIKNKEGQEYCVECADKKPINQEQFSFICEFCCNKKEQKPIHAHVKNMPDKRDSREITILCSYCSYARAIKENFYCPRFSNGRDSWDTNIPEFDCFCEEKKY